MLYIAKSSYRASWSRVSKEVNRKFILVVDTARTNPTLVLSDIYNRNNIY